MFSFQGAVEFLFKKLSETSLSIIADFFWCFNQFLKRSGGPKWTRTIDLTIISRVL